MFILFGILCLLVAVALVLAVMVQNSKGGGLSSSLVGGNATQMLGARRSSEMIEKITWYLAGGLAVFAFIANISISSTTAINHTSRIESLVETGAIIQNSNVVPTQEQIENQVQAIESENPTTEEGK